MLDLRLGWSGDRSRILSQGTTWDLIFLKVNQQKYSNTARFQRFRIRDLRINKPQGFSDFVCF